MTDTFERNIDYMRVSVTDRCNLRCKYCMPHDLPLVSHSDVLRNEEFLRVCWAASECGVKRVRITGGEPFARRDCVSLMRGIKALPGIEEVAVTTNGVLLKEHLRELSEIGISRVNISLDTLDAQAYREMTGRHELDRVLDALFTALEMGFRVKINCVPIRGFNDGEYAKLAELAREHPLDIRFIEAMPIGFGRDFAPVPGDEILSELRKIHPDLMEDDQKRGFGPARYYRDASLMGGIGFINAVSHGFCASCNRVRLTSEGFLKLCLYHGQGVDLRAMMRGGASDGELAAAFAKAVAMKPEKHSFESGLQPEKRVMSRIGG